MKILITGATGLIGKELGKALVEKGHELFVITRHVERARELLPFPCTLIAGDLDQGPLKNQPELRTIDAVINLMGETVSKRWTERRKRNIYESRILGTRHVIESLVNAPRIFISASATGYYGSRGDAILNEESAPGEDFLSQVCQDWEEELLSFSYGENASATRVVALRTGMVLSSHGGALESMLPIFNTGLGGSLGNGLQWMSWIHIQDAVGLILHALERSGVQGAMNVCSPNPVINKAFTKALAGVLNKSTGPRVPKLALTLALGEMSIIALSSQRAVPEKALRTGYKFKFPELKPALENLFPTAAQGETVFEAEQFLSMAPEKVFSFFSDAHNLERITPPELHFHILKSSKETVSENTEIDYRLTIHGFPAKWKTLIQEWDPPHKFVDTQLQGPYDLWNHTHEFIPFGGGTLMRDRVRYRLPFGAFGKLLAGAVVKKDVDSIFAFRRRYLAKNLESILKGKWEA